MWLRWISQLSILIPAVLMLVAGFIVAVRSVDVRLSSVRGVRQVASNLSYTVATVALCLTVLMLMQGIVGYNLWSRWWRRARGQTPRASGPQIRLWSGNWSRSGRRASSVQAASSAGSTRPCAGLTRRASRPARP